MQNWFSPELKFQTEIAFNIASANFNKLNIRYNEPIGLKYDYHQNKYVFCAYVY